MKEIIFLDLDGTILDVSERVFAVYKDILEKHNERYLSEDKYLILKRKKAAIEEILKKTGAEKITSIFKREWRLQIESASYLNLDRIPYKRRMTLENLKKSHMLILVTLRNHPKKALQQLRRKKICSLFDKILISSGRNSTQKWKIKVRLMQKINFNTRAIIVGDTETDILAGRYLKIKTLAVLSGMRERKILKAYRPDNIVKDISYLKKILVKKYVK